MNRHSTLCALAIALIAAAILVPGIQRPFDATEPNAGLFFGTTVGNLTRHGFEALQGVPMLYTLLDVPHEFGTPYLTHPPGLTWLFWICGSAEWQMRLCTLVATVVGAWCVMALTTRRAGQIAGVIAGCAYCVFPALAAFGQVTYASVILALGLLMLTALDRLADREAPPGRLRAGALHVLTFSTALVGTWVDYMFAAFCLGAAALCFGPLRTWIRTLAAPASGAVLGLATTLLWKRSVADPRPAMRSPSVGEIIDEVILTRPAWDDYIDTLMQSLTAGFPLPVLLVALAGVLTLAQRRPRLTMALLTVAAFAPVVFATHIATEHHSLLAYAAPLIAVGTGIIGSEITRSSAVPLTRIALLLLLLGLPLSATLQIRGEGRTDHFARLGAALSSLSIEREAAGTRRYLVLHNTFSYGAYHTNENAFFTPILDPDLIAGGQDRVPAAHGIRYLHLQHSGAAIPPNPREAELRAYLEQFPRERYAGLETSFVLDAPSDERLVIEGAWVYTIRPAALVTGQGR